MPDTDVMLPADWRARIPEHVGPHAHDRVTEQILNDPGLLFEDDDEELLYAERVPADVYRAEVHATFVPFAPRRTVRVGRPARRATRRRERRTARRRTARRRRASRAGDSGDDGPAAAARARRLKGWRG